MPGHRPVGRLRRSLTDVEGVTQLAAALGEALGSQIAHRPTRAQAALQLPAQRTSALEEQRQIDRLVRHPQHRILRIASDSHPAICCGDHHSESLASTTARSRGSVTSLAALGR